MDPKLQKARLEALAAMQAQSAPPAVVEEAPVQEKAAEPLQDWIRDQLAKKIKPQIKTKVGNAGVRG